MLKGGNYTLLQPMYPLLIQQFVDDYALDNGVAVDIGIGPGTLGIEMAKITKMDIVFVDIEQEALATAEKNVAALPLDNKCRYVQGDVHALPLTDNSVDFVMSRGSIWFWENPVQGLKEIERILKPDGVAIVGGGFGRYLPPTMRSRLLQSVKKGLEKRKEKRPTLVEFEEMVKKAALNNYKVMDDGYPGSGKWVEIRK